MTTKNQVKERRAKVAQMMAKSVYSIKEISQALGIGYDTVDNDIRWLREQTKPWLLGLAGDGFAFDCKVAIDKLMSLEVELEDMRQTARTEKADTDTRISIIRELRDTTIARISIEGEGPTLLALKKIKKGELVETS